MKSEVLLIVAMLSPGLVCVAQDKPPADQPAPAMAAPQVSTASPAAISGTHAADAPAAVSGIDSSSYVIGPSDGIVVSVWKEPSLSGNLLVRPDGMISLPLLGDVQASGLTCLQLADELQTKLKKFVQDPKVSVVLVQIKSKVIYMLGEVAKRGPIEMTPGMTLLQAMADAGGVNDYGNPKKMYLLRDEGGVRKKIPLHYKDAVKGNSNYDIVLKPGDTIVVP